MAETCRTFIAIELPAQVRDFLGRCQERLRRSGGDVKWVRPDLIHLTLAFLGEVPTSMLPDLESAVRGAVAAAARGPIAIRAGGVGQFPPHGMPRVVWAGVVEASGQLAALQKAVAEATEVYAEKPEDRDFSPHLTLGRVKSGKDVRTLASAIQAMAAEEGPQFEAREIIIFKSVLAADGPTYTALARIGLGA
jgi:RNA 2',3'-cyclic 3'-phosphodiesterase